MSIIIHFNSASFIPSSVTLPSTSSCISKVKRKLAMVPGIDHSDRTVMTDDESSMVDIATSNTLYPPSITDLKGTRVLGSCFGLPYQDHNYGAPPPATPPSESCCPSPPHANGVPDEETNLSVVSASTANEETQEGSITRCICGFEHDDEYMICCDACLVWQHVDCMGLDRNKIPETYLCEKCQPRKVDRHKAKVLQTRKKVAMTDSSDTDDERGTKNTERRTRPRSKRRKREEEKIEKNEQGPVRKSRNVYKHKERMEAKRSKLRRSKNKESTSTADEEAQDAWDISLEWCEKNFETAITNQYTPEVQHLARTLPLQGHEQKLMELLLTRNCKVLDGNQKKLISIYDIPRDQPLIEYVGKFLLATQFYELHPAFSKRLFPFVMFYTLDDEEICVDATVYGNEARFIRRSCKPNAELRHLVHNGNLHLYVSSTRAVFKDDEIALPLDLNLKESIKDVECACESDDCILKFHPKNGNIDASHDKRRRTRKFTLSADDDSSHSFVCLNVSPTKLKSSPVKSNSQTSDGKSDHETEEQAKERRKMTREERKMDAIMRAFDQMEKAAKRRQQALERQKSHLPKSEESSDKPESLPVPKEEDKVATASGSEKQGGEDEKVHIPTLKPKKGKRRRGSGASSRRRTRTNSGGSDILSPEENVQVNNNVLIASTLDSEPPADTEASVEAFHVATTCSTVTSAVSAPVSSSVVLKTKRFLLHEWLQEKCETPPSTPSTPPACVRPEVKWNTVSSPTCYVQCTRDNSHSTGISAAHLRRSSTSGRINSVPVKSCSEQGSAKKRWLRQAMYDCNSYDDPLSIDTSTMEGLQLENGYLSPVGHGEMGSPGGADDTVTPLKKRRLMRESLDCTSSPLSPSFQNSESTCQVQGSDSPEVKTEIVLDTDYSEQQVPITAKLYPLSDLLPKSKADVKINGIVPKSVENPQKPSFKEEESTPDRPVRTSLSPESIPTLTATPPLKCLEVEFSMQTNSELEEQNPLSLKTEDVQECDNLDLLPDGLKGNVLTLCFNKQPLQLCNDINMQSNLQTSLCSTPVEVQNVSYESPVQTCHVKRKITFSDEQCGPCPSILSVDNTNPNLTDSLKVKNGIPTPKMETASPEMGMQQLPSKLENLSGETVNKVLNNVFILTVNSENKTDRMSGTVSPHPNLHTRVTPVKNAKVDVSLDCKKEQSESTVDVPKNILTDVTIAEPESQCSSSVSSDDVNSHSEKLNQFSEVDSKSSHLCNENSNVATKTACASATQKRKVSLSEYRMRMKDGSNKRSSCEAFKRSINSPAISATAIPETLPEQVTLAPLPLFNTSQGSQSPLQPAPVKALKTKKEPVVIEEKPLSDIIEHRENLSERLKREFGLDEDSGGMFIQTDCILTSTANKSTSNGPSALPVSAQPPPPPPPPPKRPTRPQKSSISVAAAASPSQFGFPVQTSYARPSYIVPQVPSAQFIPVQPTVTTPVMQSIHPSPGVQCSIRPPLLPSPHSFAPSLTSSVLRPTVQHEYSSVNAQNYAVLVQQPPPPPPPKSYAPHVYQPGLYK